MRDGTDGYEGYGWNNFTCASREAKESYLMVMLIDNMPQQNKSLSQFYSGTRSVGEFDWKTLPFVYMDGKKLVFNLNEYKAEDYVKIVKRDFIQFGYDKIFTHFESLIESFSENFESIDHQSVIRLPNDPRTNFIHHGFAKDFCKFILEN